MCLKCDPGMSILFYPLRFISALTLLSFTTKTGTYSSTNFTVECELCSNGLFTSKNGSTSCETCPVGMQPHQDIGSSKCDPLPAGQFGSGTSCPINTYSKAGSVECTTCPSGKYSDMGASQCIECDFMYRLSTHCDVPVAGMLLIVSTLIIVKHRGFSTLSKIQKETRSNQAKVETRFVSSETARQDKANGHQS